MGITRRRAGGRESPLDYVLERVRTRAPWFTGTVVVNTNLSSWAEYSRERVFVIFVDAQEGGMRRA